MIEIDMRRLEELISHPGESLAIEIKRWIDPDLPDGIAKIVRAVLALRNHGGGYFIVGFDNDTLQPDNTGRPGNVLEKFHIDKIQRLMAKYSSEPFEVAVGFPVRDEQEFPVVIVPSGVKTPVAVKADLIDQKPGSTKLLSTDDVYVRTLRSNNTPSTAKASWKDWPALMEVCFDNREADIGRFLRRHLAGLTPDVVGQFSSMIAGLAAPTQTTVDMLKGILDHGELSFQHIKSEQAVNLPPHGTWEVALLMHGNLNSLAPNRDFLNLLDSSNPDLTGWPIWLDSRGFRNQNSHPYVVDGAWEALIVSIDSGWGGNHIDFMRLDPAGKFYLRRALQDDMQGSNHAPTPLTVLDFGLPIIRTAEAIVVGLAFAKAMGCSSDQTTLSYAFQWTGLKGRQLSSWASPGRFISSHGRAYQNTVLSTVDVPLETPLSALSPFVLQVVTPLFAIFDGFEPSSEVVEELTRRLIERQL